MDFASVRRKTRLGRLLVAGDLIDEQQLAQAMETQSRRPGASLGVIVLERGWITEGQLQHCLRRQAFLRLSAALLSNGAVSMRQPLAS